MLKSNSSQVEKKRKEWKGEKEGGKKKNKMERGEQEEKEERVDSLP